jgi:hypothetical protein
MDKKIGKVEGKIIRIGWIDKLGHHRIQAFEWYWVIKRKTKRNPSLEVTKIPNNMEIENF